MSKVTERSCVALTTASLIAACAGLIPAALASADDSTWSMRAIQLQTYNADAGGWVPANVSVTTDTSPLVSGMKVFGTAGDDRGGNDRAFKLSASEFQSGGTELNRGMRLIAVYDGVLNRPFNNVADSIVTAFKFAFNTSGGVVDMFNVETGYGLFDGADNLLQLVGSSGATGLLESGYNEMDFQYVDGFGGADASQGTRIVGDFVINFDWTGTSDSDTLEFLIPQNSIDITMVPTPGAAALLGLAGVVAGRRHR